MMLRTIYDGSIADLSTLLGETEVDTVPVKLGEYSLVY